MDIYKLFSSETASGDAQASLDIQREGHIVGISADLACTGCDALGDGGTVELSFASTSGFASNDTKASLLTLRAWQQFLTSGGGPVQSHSDVSALAVAVAAGERLYLHFEVAGTGPTVYATVYVFVMPLVNASDRADPRRR